MLKSKVCNKLCDGNILGLVAAAVAAITYQSSLSVK
jgi:hypothetical protein